MGETRDRIKEVFKGSTVFISGGTGFVGKALIEKLLRSTDVKKIYLLIRKKKGKSPVERVNDIFNNVLYNVLREQNPDAFKKCIPILGDVGDIDLGISKEDGEMLKNEVEFIFHSAATTRFDDTIKYSVTINTRGTKFMLDLAEQCKKLKVFFHVSSAYIFPHEDVTQEKPYAPPADPHEVLHSINWIKEETMTSFSKQLLGDIPNTYTFSKALAEALVIEKVGKLPVVIGRLAVVIPTYQEPIPGWCNNLQGPMGLFVAGGKGVLRTIFMDSKSHANLVPVDCSVAGMLVGCWHYLSNKNAPYIFNMCVPEKDLKVSWEEIMELGANVIQESVPFNGILWYPGGTITQSRWYFKINFFLFQLIPAIFIDFLLLTFSYKPILYNIQIRVYKGMDMFEYYTTKAWDFSTENTEMVRKLMNEKEKENFLLESNNIDIKRYLTDSIKCVKKNILKETDDMLPSAFRQMKIMYALDKTIKMIFFMGFGYYFYNLIFLPLLNVLK